MRRTMLPFLLLPAVLAACGTRQPPAPAAHEQVSAAEPGPALPPERAEERITAIDAAIGDGAALPEDHYGPSGYDLAQRAEASRSRAVDTAPRERAAARTAPTGASTTDLLHSDDAVTTGV